jgi:hypothetical protein
MIGSVAKAKKLSQSSKKGSLIDFDILGYT